MREKKDNKKDNKEKNKAKPYTLEKYPRRTLEEGQNKKSDLETKGRI